MIIISPQFPPLYIYAAECSLLQPEISNTLPVTANPDHHPTGGEPLTKSAAAAAAEEDPLMEMDGQDININDPSSSSMG